MMTLKHAIAPALVAASMITLAVPASAAPAMTGRPDFASVAQTNNVTEVQYRRGYHRGNTAAAAGVGFAAGALIGAAAANASNGPYYYNQPTYYRGPAYRSYNYYEPAPTYYEPAPTYYYGEPTYRGSYGRANGPQNSRAAEDQRLRTGS